MTVVIPSTDMFMLAGMKEMDSIRVEHDRAEELVRIAQPHGKGDVRICPSCMAVLVCAACDNACVGGGEEIIIDVPNLRLFAENLLRLADLLSLSPPPKGSA